MKQNAPQAGLKPSHSVPQAAPSSWRIALAFSAIYLLWGSNFLAVRYAVEGFPPFVLMAIRSVLAGTLLMAWGRLSGHPWPDLRQILRSVPAGALLFLGGHGLLAVAQTRIPSGVAALAFSTVPLWMVLFGGAGQVRSRGILASGLVFGLLGVGLLVAPQLAEPNSRVDPAGVAVLLCGAASWALGSLRSRDPRLPDSIAMKAGTQLNSGGAALLAVAAGCGELGALEMAPVAALFALAYLVAIGSLLCFAAYMWLLGVRNAAQVGTYTFINPLVAVLLGWAVASEPLTKQVGWASLFIIAGVALIHLAGVGFQAFDRS